MTTKQRSVMRPTLDATKLAEKVEMLHEAKIIESEGGEWRIGHVCAVLDISRATVYETAALRRIAHRYGKRSLRWNPADVRNLARNLHATRAARTA